MPSLGETVIVAWEKAFSLSEISARLHVISLFSVMAGYFHGHAWIIWTVLAENSMLGLIYSLEMLNGGIEAWELDVWDKCVS